MLRGKSEQAAVVMDKLGRDEDNFLQLKEHTSCKKQTEDDDYTGVCSSIHTTIQRVSNLSVIKPFVTGIALMTFFQVSNFFRFIFLHEDDLYPIEYIREAVTTCLSFTAHFQGTGYPIFIGSAADILSGVLPNVDQNHCAVIVGANVVFGAGISIPLSRACKRRTLLITSAFGVTLCQTVMGMYNYYEDSLKDEFGWILLVTFIVYICSFMVNTYVLKSTHIGVTERKEFKMSIYCDVH